MKKRIFAPQKFKWYPFPKNILKNNIKTMSFEKPPAPTTVKENASKGPTKEESPIKVEGGDSEKSFIDPSRFLSVENQKIFSDMSEKGKAFFGRVYEGLYKTPGINKMVGKMEIAYNQFWIKRNETKAVDLKKKLDSLDSTSKSLDQSKKEIEAIIIDFKQKNIPGSEALELKIKDIDKEKNNLLYKKNKVQSKLEKKENVSKIYTNRRDAIADKLIEKYQEKIDPIERELKSLKSSKDKIDLTIAVSEMKYKEQEERLNKLEKSRMDVENSLRGLGMPERQIRNFKAVKDIEKSISEIRRNIGVNRNEIFNKKRKIEEKISKADAKGNKVKDQKEAFIKIKEGRPIKINIPKREEKNNFQEREEIDAHIRNKNDIADYYATGTPESQPETSEKKESKDNKKELQYYLAEWNKYLQKKYKKALIPGEIVDLKDFSTCTGLNSVYSLDFEDFRNILGKYYKFKRVNANKIGEDADDFFSKKINNKR